MVTWAEFVEAALLREYRRTHNVPMAELRAFIDKLRDRYGVPYPLATSTPFVMDRQLVRDAQDEAGLDPDFCLVAEVRGQLIREPHPYDSMSMLTCSASLAYSSNSATTSRMQATPEDCCTGGCVRPARSLYRPRRTPCGFLRSPVTAG